MEQFDLHVCINPRRENDGGYPVTIKTADNKRYHTILTIPWEDGEPGKLAAGFDVGPHLEIAFSSTGILDKLWDRYYQNNMNTTVADGVVLLEIKAPELQGILWEPYFDNSPWCSELANSRNVFRYLPKPSSVILKPLHFPIDVAVVTGAIFDIDNVVPSSDPLQYLRSTMIRGATSDFVRQTLHGVKFDIVHLIGNLDYAFNNDELCFQYDETGINAKELRKLLKRCQARVLILDMLPGYNSVYLNASKLLEFAHSLHDADGPAIIVLQRPSSVPPAVEINDIYWGIIHDQSLSDIIKVLPDYWIVSLLLAEDSLDIIRISSASERINARMQKNLEEAEGVLELLQDQGKYLMADIDTNTSDVLAKVKSLTDNLATTVNNISMPDYLHETGATEPFTLAEMEGEAAEHNLIEMNKRVQRVVNAWFETSNGIHEEKNNLEPEIWYEFFIQIGPATEKSIVRKAPALPENELLRFYSEKGLELRVVLFTSDFTLKESEQTLILPRPPEETIPLAFSVLSPKDDCVARMRVGIYFGQNLLQSLMVTAAVGQTKAASGTTADVDYALSGNLANIEMLPKRTLNIALNDKGDGTHSFYVVGEDLSKEIHLGEGEMSSAIAEARLTLQKICGAPSGPAKGPYRFQPDNHGTESNFIEDIKLLAEVGFGLYNDFIMKNEKQFNDALKEKLKKSGATIQIASTKSAKYVFPWALVYDHPLVLGDNEVCPDFLDDVRTGGGAISLENQRCIANGCSHHNDKNVICPSGFWGYRHIIEQPLTVPVAGQNGQGHEIQFSINGNKEDVLMAVSQKLKYVGQHKNEFEAKIGAAVDFANTKNLVGKGLQRTNIPLVYFYCHGGRYRTSPCLYVGRKDDKPFIPSDLEGFEVDWPLTHPLVFINGCETVALTPDDLVQFNNQFSYRQAAGVIGTEISIPEVLARYFANGFFELLPTTNIGDVIRAMRLRMLGQYNPLGLAYTPYCSANLKIKLN